MLQKKRKPDEMSLGSVTFIKHMQEKMRHVSQNTVSFV